MLASLNNTLDEELPVETDFIVEQLELVVEGIQGLGKRLIAAFCAKKPEGLLAATRKFNDKLPTLAGAFYEL